ncbi:MAG: pilus assembly PilX N-terminal domain-containing protein [Nitrospirae bacterium]|nr:pilus assembly PilX N-terminal domain-containing protein [Nitrospirota bacterium]
MKKMTTDHAAILDRRLAIGNERGIALVMALIITLVVFLLIMSTVYMTTTATKISGAGKRYASASEAADGAVEVMKDAINLTMYGEPISSLPLTNTSGLLNALSNINAPTKVTVNLSGTSLFQTYTAEIIVERLYSQAIPGGRLEFARSAGGSGGTAVYYKINTVVTGPNNSRAETTALYRFVG